MKNKTIVFKLKDQSGMTLIELLVVLALMAGLAGLALTTVGDMDSRGRYDATANSLKLIREAVVGEGDEPGRFILDMGRLPVVRAQTDTNSDGSTDDEEQARVLQELWEANSSLGYAALAPSGENWPGTEEADLGLPDQNSLDFVSLQFGWNGPYLQVDNPTDARIYDGFGNAWQVDVGAGWQDGDAAAVNAEIQQVRSLGVDGTAAETSWDETNTETAVMSVPTANLTMRIKVKDESSLNTNWVSASANSTSAWAAGGNLVWADGESVSVGDYVASRDLQHYFLCTDAGVTAGAENWDYSGTEFEETSGGVKWIYQGRLYAALTHMRIRLYQPDVSTTSKSISVFGVNLDGTLSGIVQDSDLEDAATGGTAPSLTVGPHGIYVYGIQYYPDLDTTNGTFVRKKVSLGSKAEVINLSAGSNYMNLYLD